MEETRFVFMGSPDFALPALQALVERFNVVGVVTQPDRPAGRGRRSQAPPVKVWAQAHGLPVFQPARLREPAAVDQLKDWQPGILVVTAYGQILSEQVLAIAPAGSLNVHASLLPRWRGAAPIQAAILHGDRVTGVTIMKMDPGLDTGPILSQRSIQIDQEDTAGSLAGKLAELGAKLLVETLPIYLRGGLPPRPQDDTLATHAPMLKKAQGRLDFSKDAEALARQVRAFDPWPGSFITIDGERLKILKAHAAHTGQPAPDQEQPGARLIHDGLPAFRTLKGLLVLERVQPAGRRVMDAADYLRGKPDWEAHRPKAV